MIVFVDCSYSLLTSLGTGCHKWLNCVFARVLNWVAVLHQVLCFHNHMTKKRSLGCPFLWFQEKTPIQNESDAREHWLYITCTYFDMTRYDVIAYVTWVSKWHHSTFFLKFVSCVFIWYKNVPFETWIEIFRGKPMLWKCVLYFN